MRRQRRSFTDIICENCKYLPTKRSRNKRKPIPKESDVKTFNYTAHLWDKRDSIVVVAQLSPEFTARLVDRWRDLEETAVNIPKTLPEALRLAADLAEQKMQLENQLAIAAPKVEFADRVGEASGILIGNFAKVVGIGPNKLFAWMRDHKILIASGSRRNVPMQEYMDRGYFTVKETAVTCCLLHCSKRISGQMNNYHTC